MEYAVILILTPMNSLIRDPSLLARGTWPVFSRQKELKSPCIFMQSGDRPEIELVNVAGNVIESVNFAKSHGFYDITCNFELDFGGCRV